MTISFSWVNAMAPQIKLSDLLRSVEPFVAADLLVLALLILVPALVLWLPAYMRG